MENIQQEMTNEQIKLRVLERIQQKYKIKSYQKVVENIIDIAIDEIQKDGN